MDAYVPSADDMAIITGLVTGGLVVGFGFSLILWVFGRNIQRLFDFLGGRF